MNDEIKLMLNIIKDVSEHKEGSRNGLMILSCKDYETLYDYITNLQQENHELKSELECYENGAYYSSKVDELEQENERLKEKTKEQSLLLIDYQDMEQRYNDYKSRCEKAVEYINVSIEEGNYFEDDIATDISEPTYDKYVNSNSLLNILQNGSEEK